MIPPEPPTDSGSLLVVDDDEMNLDMISRRLRHRGYQVEGADCGPQALEILGERQFDLVLLDVMMPGLNGMEVLEAIRREHPATALPVIMATAKDHSEDIVRALELGANDYVTKPLNFPVVVARIQTQLALKRAMDDILRLERSLAERNAALEAANARMLRGLEAAARIQLAALPRELPRFREASFAWVFRPCDEMAGDGLNIVPVDDRRVALYVLDVSGHGVASALLSVAVGRVLAPPADPASILAADGVLADPAEVADQLNRRFPYDLDTGQFFTLLYGILDVATGEFRFVTAGHPGPILIPARGEPRALEMPGFPIGLAEDAYTSQTLNLGRGDRLILYSDGVPDALGQAGEAFGPERLLGLLDRERGRPPGPMLEVLRSEIEAWCAPDGPRDDISLLAVELAPSPAGNEGQGRPTADVARIA